MKTALVTGGAGFIGHHLIQHLLVNTDYNIVCLDRLDTSGNLNRISEIIENSEDVSRREEYRKRFKFVFHDLKAEINSQLASQLGKPELVFHLAASSHVDRSIEDPLSFVMDNVVGTTNLLNFCRQLDNLEYIQNFSTDEVFGDANEGQAYEEWDRHCPKNPYSASKSGAESLGIAFANTYRLPLVTTNCMNVIGERQHPEKFFPMCIKKILNDEVIFIHSYPGSIKPGTRFYVHARNVADVSLFLSKNSTIGEKYNLVGQEEISNLDLAKRIAKHMGKELHFKMVDFHSSRPGHDLRYALKDTKLGAMGYSYPICINESIERSIDWTLNNKKWLEE